MPKNDWKEVISIFKAKEEKYISNFINSNETFCPNTKHQNIFDKNSNAFSAKLLKKSNPANWIPIYKQNDLSDYLKNSSLMPIRCGQGEFFFYKGDIVFDLTKINYQTISIDNLDNVEDFMPLTLQNFHRNENAYLNKALAVGILNHFLDSQSLEIFHECIKRGNYRRLLYGQFGKIKTNFELQFKTKKGSKSINKGFQFEMDLVLENEHEIIVFEAKQGLKARENFILLQLYYPLIYLAKITEKKKKIRTIFIDISTRKIDIYRLTEFKFNDFNFDDVEVLKSVEYIN